MTTLRHVNRRGLARLRDVLMRRAHQVDITADLEGAVEWAVSLVVRPDHAELLKQYNPLVDEVYDVPGLTTFRRVVITLDASNRAIAERTADRMAARVGALPIYTAAVRR